MKALLHSQRAGPKPRVCSNYLVFALIDPLHGKCQPRSLLFDPQPKACPNHGHAMTAPQNWILAALASPHFPEKHSSCVVKVQPSKLALNPVSRKGAWFRLRACRLMRNKLSWAAIAFGKGHSWQILCYLRWRPDCTRLLQAEVSK